MTSQAIRLAPAITAALPGLRRYALALSGNMAAADDLVQDCIERALRRIGTLQAEEKMASWLRSILFNAFIDDRRRLRHRVEAAEPVIMDALDSLEASAEERAELTDVVRAMGRLPLLYRQVLMLVGVEGLSYREAADEIGVPIGTVMSRLARGRALLRQALDPAAPVTT